MSLGESTPETATPERLFEPSPTPRMPASEIALIILAMVLVFGGFYMMALAFSVPDWAFWLFGGGIIVDAIGFWVAFGLIPSREK